MLEVAHVRRSFSGVEVLHDVSFRVRAGRMTGFVGANGAGKTTTMRIILGVLAADAGTVRLGGTAVDREDRRRFGYMPEERGLYPKMKVAEQVAYLARLHGMHPRAARKNTAALLDRLGLAERANDPVEKLSLGNQQRVQIAAALAHDPEVLVLDEPFSGLDPIAVVRVQEVLADYAARGVPVLFSSHQLDIVERLCDDLVIIAGGRIRAAGERESLRRDHGGSRYAIQAPDTAWLAGMAGVSLVAQEPGGALFEADAATAQDVLRAALGRGPVTSFAPRLPSLAEIFREVTT